LDTALANLEANRPQPFDPDAFVPDVTLNLSGPVIVNTEPDGTVVVTDATGKQHTLPPGTEAAIVDDKGNATFIDSKGKEHSATAAQAAAAINREYNLKLKFTKAPAAPGQYGFDSYEANEPEVLQNRYTKLDGDYFIPYKSVEAGHTDAVVAVLDGSGIDKSKIRFEMGGVPVPATPFSGDESTVTVSSKSDGEEEGLIAILSPEDDTKKDQVLGRVNVVTYNKINKNVVIIPVNENKFTAEEGTALQSELNRIYSQSVVGWSVTVKPGIQVESINPFDVGETGMLTNYTDHMKNVINAYKDNMKDGEDTYYLFLVGNPSKPEIGGFMPRSKQAGFIFKDKTGSGPALARTVAHELGHGAFNLHHIFMEENFSVTKNSTDNLMDYNGGDRLYKYQWDMMRYPPIVMGLFEGDDEAASESWGTLVDEKHTELFDYIYERNHVGKLEYLTEIENLLAEKPTQESMEISSDGDNKDWVNAWNIRIVNSETVLKNAIEVIQKASNGQKIDAIYLRPRHIYIAKYNYNNREYPIAIYNAGTTETMNKVFTKVQIKDIDDLEDDEIKKHVYIEETFFSYFVMAFYEENKNQPTLIIQVEKFPLSDLWNNSMEEWAKFLKILIEEDDAEEDDCDSGFCCTKCGKDLSMTLDRFSTIFPNVTKDKDELVAAFNVSLKENGFEYNTCERQAKIFAQIAIETNGLKAKVEGKGKTWRLTGDNSLLEYFKRTLKAKERWFNQDFWDTKLYKQFVQEGFYENIESTEEIAQNDRYKVITEKDFYGYYGDVRQDKYLVKVPIAFELDTAGTYKKYASPTTAEKLEIEKRIFNYAYGNNLGNHDYLTTDDGFDFRGRGGIQITGRRNYETLKSNLEKEPYSLFVDIVSSPELVADTPELVIYSCFIHFKTQLTSITKLDQLTIKQVSALVNTGNENKTANHEKERSDKYTVLIGGVLKCD
jgi:predicted chitinase